MKLASIDASGLLRIFRSSPGRIPNPLFFGKDAKNRFDCPFGAATRFGVNYAAYDLATCFAETITREDNRKPLESRSIAVSEAGRISGRFVAELGAVTKLRVANMTDVALYGLGAEAGEFHSADYPTYTQPWAFEIFERPENVDGLLYRSRFLNGRNALAIFERGALRVGLFARNVVPLADHKDYENVLDELNIALLP